MTRVLRHRHNIQPGQPNDFRLLRQDEFLRDFERVKMIATTVLAGLVGISLIVGGIGIMNVMLVSVTERTGGIWVRIAVGAKRRQIMFQFLVESAVLSLVGGVIGIGVGVAAAKLTTAWAGWPTIISPAFLVLAFVFSATVGIVFGLYPAHKASRLNPIDALRYE